MVGVLLAFGLVALALIEPASNAHANHAEGWTDDPNLINVSTIAQLNAIRWDAEGDGVPTSFTDDGVYDSTLQIDYWNAFGGWENAWLAILDSGNPSAPHNCPDGCKGYELTQDLSLTGDNELWRPIASYSGVFDGNGHVITTLHVLRQNERQVGMFRTLARSGKVKNLGIVDADVQGYNVDNGSNQATGVIAGRNHGTIENVFIFGQVSGNNGVGGIAGRSDGTIRTSWTDIIVRGGSNAGGLVGVKSGGEIHSTHSRGSVTGTSNVGGLVGELKGGGKIEDSYTLAETSSGFVLRGNSGGTVITSYDLTSTAKAALKGTTRFGVGIYANWDRVWHLGNGLEYPALQVDFNDDGNPSLDEFGHEVAPQRELEVDPNDPTTDPKYHDRLIDVSTIEQLNAIRLDLDGDGVPTSFKDNGVYDSTLQIDYWNVFGGWRNAQLAILDSGNPSAPHNCPGGCIGYELTADIDFTGTPFSYGEGWQPIGDSDNPYNGVFEGNGRTISNGFVFQGYGRVRSPSHATGIFAALGENAFVQRVGLVGNTINGDYNVGGLAGVNAGTIRESYVVGSPGEFVEANIDYVHANFDNAGGLVGLNTSSGVIERVWTNIWTRASRDVGPGHAGGIIGANEGTLSSSYSVGTVSGRHAGGLVGAAKYTLPGIVIWDSYTWSLVEFHSSPNKDNAGVLGGLVGVANGFSNDFISDSYYDRTVGRPRKAVGNLSDVHSDTGKTTIQLTTPTFANGIYQYWEPAAWDFRTTGEYPLLKVDFNGDGRATSQEFHQDHPGAPSGTIPYFADRTVFERGSDYASQIILHRLDESPLYWFRGFDIQPLTLPSATSGDGTLTYSISPALIPGVTFNAETLTLSGRPTLTLGTGSNLTFYEHVRQYTLTVTDEHGDFDSINFCIAYYDVLEHYTDRLVQFGNEYIKVPDKLAECNSGRSNIRGVAGGGGPKFVFGDTPPLVKDSLGGPINQTLPEATGGSGEVTYEIDRLPAGMTFDPNSRVLSGKLSIDDTDHLFEVHLFTLIATDGAGRRDKLDFCMDHFTNYDYWRSAGFNAIPGCSQSGDLSLDDRWVLDSGLGSAGGDRATTVNYVTNALGQIVPELRFTDQVPSVEFTHQADVGVFRLPTAVGGTTGARTYSLNPTTLPAGLSYDAETRGITGTPTELQAPQEYTYTASDTGGLIAQLTFTISVVEDVEPTFGTATVDGQSWTLNSDIGAIELPEASGGNGALTYKVEPALPAGVAFDAETRALSGAPTYPQAEASYTYTATDRDGDEVSLTFTIAVADLVVVPSLSFGDAQLYDYRWHQNVHNGRVDLPAAVDGAAPLTYTVSPDLPAGLVFDAANLAIDGIPTEAQDRVQYTYTVTDANGATASLPFSIVVIADAAPSFGEQTIANQSYTNYANVGTVTLPAATGGNGDLSYALSPDLPAGLSFDAAARAITGAPTESLAETEYTYTATDFGGDTASLTFTIQVRGTGITMSVADQVTMREGDAFTYQVSLESQPAANAVVAVASDNGDVGVAPASLTFTPDNWQTAQTVTVSAEHDPNDVDDQAVISHLIDGETASSFNVSVTDDDSDREILRDFYNAADGDNWTDNTDWLSNRPLRYWHGVSTDDRGRVTRVELRDNNLVGTLAPELGKLDTLEVVSLDRNSLTDEIPVEWGDLSNLTRLAMNRNQLTGAIPAELGSLSNLSIIGLARNNLSGSLPTSLGNLTGLTRLSLHDNTALSGELPSGFTNLADLQRLAIANTGLCAPDDEAFTTWLDTVSDKPGGVATCQ